MLDITGLHHVGVVVTDMTRAVAFYTEVMGLEEIETQETGPPGAEIKWLVAADGTRIDLLKPPVERDTRHLAFSVNDFDGAVQELKDANVEILRSGYQEDGTRFLFFMDIDGNLTELSGR